MVQQNDLVNWASMEASKVGDEKQKEAIHVPVLT